ncbi:MAG: rod shape-determining protein [Clostridia bacterium]|nr:rod shape-determining protein [Clostridia bacterium]
MFRRGIGLDIGTVKTTIASVEDGILLREPTVAAVDVDTGDVLEAGEAAMKMVSDSPDKTYLCWPLWDTVVKNAHILAAILRIFLRRALGRTLLRPQVMVSVPCDLTEAQSNVVEDAVLEAGASRVHLLEAPLCAALGVGFDFAAPTGQMLVHIGASRTEAAMLFIGDMVTHISVQTGGTQFDNAIVRYMRQKHKLYIGPRTAEQIKIRLVDLAAGHEEKKLDVKGRFVDTKVPRVVTLSSREMLGALRDPLAAILDAVLTVVEQTGDDMKADIAKGGIVLTGGGVLRGMDQLIADVMGIRAKLAANADTAAAEGAALALERLGK